MKLDLLITVLGILGANGGGAIVNMLSVTSWLSYPGAEAYSAAKAAAWSLTNGIRLELAKQNTLVVGVQLGATDTDMMKGVDMPKNDPATSLRQRLTRSRPATGKCWQTR